ncbi:trypsin-like peptidase domain-containing protein [Streptomyces naphthomycinicus]|uniref:trypsin-like peptidase domain-containing protein n=1 Tax=Streptomyces naphthomycinicus TaxID=2872625 RepID=UPI001CEDBE28|nr:trypsin-like peptidase domain-containing protein [Streptomyces sp. TML10]
MTASAERGLRPERVAEIIADRPDGRPGRRGTGYLVAPRTVLTAAHVVDGAPTVRVRCQADRPGERLTRATVAWRHEGVDIAVLTADRDLADGPPAAFGRVGEQDTVLRCTAAGFPRFKLRTAADGSRFRDVEHIDATCAVLSNRREGTLDLRTAAPPPGPPEHGAPAGPDPWEGMSGAAVFGNGLLIGVVDRRHPADGLPRLAAGRVDRWAETLSSAERAALEEALGQSLDPRALPDAVPADAHDLVQRVHRAQLEEVFAPERLEGRDTELRALLAFCSGPEPYLWIRGRPWAGKTSLVAWFALHPPRGVVPVWFFVTARRAGQADGDAYTRALVDQLAVHAGRDPLRGGPGPVPPAEATLLLREAAERVTRQGRTLVLVVDGLDEDQALAADGSGTSIAALLPHRPPPGVRVLVTSRTGPELPPDVRGDHPLRHCRLLELTATAAARHTEHEARHDLGRALSGDPLQRDLVGLLAAARGTLTTADLRELTGARHYELTRTLGGSFGRVLRAHGGESQDGADPHGRPGPGHLFAHETLLATAVRVLGPDVDGYRQRLFAWAEGYAQRGWPEDTPAYLLQPYGRLVAHLRDPQRATALATDVRRRDRLRLATGSDAVCLAEIATARRAARAADPDDLAAPAVLAAVEDLVARRNESLHPDLPAVHARLGRARHAIGLARSVFDPLDRGRALGAVAEILAGQGYRRAVELAEEALRLSRRGVAEGRPHRDYDITAAEGRLAAVLALTGRTEEALRRIADLPEPGLTQDVPVLVRALVATATATAVEAPETATALLRRAEEVARTPHIGLPTAARAMARVAEGWAAVGDPGNRARLYDGLADGAFRLPLRDGETLAALEDVLRRARPEAAEHLRRLAEADARERLRGSGRHDEEWQAAYELDAVTLALAVARRDEEAIARIEAARTEGAVHVAGMFRLTWTVIAERRARAGLAGPAWTAFRAAWQHGETPPEGERPAAALAALLAGAGAAEQSETLLLTAEADVPGWATAEALTALADHHVTDDPERALRLLHRAERVPGAVGGKAHVHPPAPAALATALAVAGRPDEGEELAALLPPRLLSGRGHALAVIAFAAAAEDPDRAVRLALQVVGEELAQGGRDPGALTTAVRALAHAGAGELVLELFRGPLAGGTRHRPAGYDGQEARALAAAGLWPHAPDVARYLADVALAGPRTGGVHGLVELLAAIGPHDDERADRVLRALRRAGDRDVRNSFSDELMMCLVIALDDREAARRRLDLAVAADQEYWPTPPGTTRALVLAALGDHAAASRIAEERDTPAARAQTYAELAAYAAGVPGAAQYTASFEHVVSGLPTVSRFLTALLPPPGGPDLPRARSLLAEALTPEGWHHAVPVLAALDPEVVPRVRDAVLRSPEGAALGPGAAPDPR